MRCKACDVILSSFEATRKSKVTHEYFDLCNRCFSSIADTIEVVEREDLMTRGDVEDNIDGYEEEENRP